MHKERGEGAKILSVQHFIGNFMSMFDTHYDDGILVNEFLSMLFDTLLSNYKIVLLTEHVTYKNKIVKHHTKGRGHPPVDPHTPL